MDSETGLAFWILAERNIYGIFKTNAGQQPVQLLLCTQGQPAYGGSGDAAEPNVFKPF